jgi:hypothetical protein
VEVPPQGAAATKHPIAGPHTPPPQQGGGAPTSAALRQQGASTTRKGTRTWWSFPSKMYRSLAVLTNPNAEGHPLSSLFKMGQNIHWPSEDSWGSRNTSCTSRCTGAATTQQCRHAVARLGVTRVPTPTPTHPPQPNPHTHTPTYALPAAWRTRPDAMESSPRYARYPVHMAKMGCTRPRSSNSGVSRRQRQCSDTLSG